MEATNFVICRKDVKNRKENRISTLRDSSAERVCVRLCLSVIFYRDVYLAESVSSA